MTGYFPDDLKGKRKQVELEELNLLIALPPCGELKMGVR
jgi:hypothetical protein